MFSTFFEKKNHGSNQEKGPATTNRSIWEYQGGRVPNIKNMGVVNNFNSINESNENLFF